MVNEQVQQSEDPSKAAKHCERHAEVLRISRQDASVETVNLLLDTLLNTLEYMGEKWEKQPLGKRLTRRMKKHLTQLLL